MSTITVPETITVDLTADESQHISEAIDQAVSGLGGGDESSHPNRASRATQAKLPAEGGTVEWSLLEAARAEKATSYLDGGPLVMLFGIPEELRSSALTKLVSALDALQEEHGVEAVNEVIERQNEAFDSQEA